VKTLTLLRHAKSGWDDPSLRDYDRSLNAKGKRAARMVGEHLRGQALTFDHVAASPARRVVETLEGVDSGYGRTLGATWDRRIYLASAVTLLDLVHEVPAGTERLLLVGHNPGLEDLALWLVPGSDDPLRMALEAKYPTATVAELTFEGEWSALTPGSARLTRFTRPRDLDPSLGPDED
jgi:phosphohistidine phosphatase